jgi:hypothetical protein
MESSHMKNMVVLKNLPSNMVEEAIIIFKETQRVKEKEFIDKSNKRNFGEIQLKSKEYILKEAEMLVSDYINKIENKKYIEKSEKSIKQKYRKLKRYSIISTFILIISLIINII